MHIASLPTGCNDCISFTNCAVKLNSCWTFINSNKLQISHLRSIFSKAFLVSNHNCRKPHPAAFTLIGVSPSICQPNLVRGIGLVRCLSEAWGPICMRGQQQRAERGDAAEGSAAYLWFEQFMMWLLWCWSVSTAPIAVGINKVRVLALVEAVTNVGEWKHAALPYKPKTHWQAKATRWAAAFGLFFQNHFAPSQHVCIWLYNSISSILGRSSGGLGLMVFTQQQHLGCNCPCTLLFHESISCSWCWSSELSVSVIQRCRFPQPRHPHCLPYFLLCSVFSCLGHCVCFFLTSPIYLYTVSCKSIHTLWTFPHFVKLNATSINIFH